MQINSRTLLLARNLRHLRNWLPFRGWQRIFQAIFPAASQAEYRFKLAVPGGEMYADASSYLDRYALLNGSIEPDELLLVRSVLKSIQARTVLDVGANVGHFAIAMAEYSHTVHAFEPNPPVYAKLLNNIELNPKRRIIAHNLGLSDDDAVLRFQSVRATHDGQGNFVDTGDLTLPVSRGDLLNIAQIDFIKIDVEGHELRTLRGLRQTLTSQRPIIMCECGCDSGSLVAVLPQDYSLFVLKQGLILARKRLRKTANFPMGENVFCVPIEKIHVFAATL